MRPPPPPIRFLLAVVGCWAGVRAYQLWPESLQDGLGVPDAAASEASDSSKSAAPPLASSEYEGPNWLPRAGQSWPSRWSWRAGRMSAAPAPLAILGLASLGTGFRPSGASLHAEVAPFAPLIAIGDPPLAYPPLLPQAATAAPQSVSPAPSRWSGSAWLFVREAAGGPDLAPGGTLGGSQAGARLSYRINGDTRRPLAIAGRLYAPLERLNSAEASLGIDWKPIAGLPVHILAERRERIGRDGRSDFAITAYGGGERSVLNGRLRLEAYGQAGVIGLKERDLFADGAVRASTPAGPLEIGVGAWGGAQPGAARLDVGPQASLRIPVGRTGVRASAEWRFRVAGDAEPGSGPALSIATDF